MLVEEHPDISTSPKSLISRIQSGDRAAETDLVNKYWQTLFYIIKRRTDDPELAADITQETLIIVINKARNGHIEKAQALASFIRQTGINLLIGHFRKETRQQTDTYEHIEIHFAHLQTDLSEKLNQQQLSELTQQIVDELPTKRDRDLLFRFFVYGQPKKTICEEFMLSEAHFDRVLYRARQRLKQILQIKYNINTEKFSLSSLLTLLLVIHSTPFSPDSEKFSNPVRESFFMQHYTTDDVMERQSLVLESMKFQNKTRSS